MKKGFFLAVGTALTLGFGIMNTNAANVSINEEVATQQEAKEKIEVSALPEAVKAALASDAYKGFQPETAFVIKGDKVLYEVAGKKDSQPVTLRFDEGGNLVS